MSDLLKEFYIPRPFIKTRKEQTMTENELIRLAERCDALDEIGIKQIGLQIAALDLYKTTKEKQEREDAEGKEPAADD